MINIQTSPALDTATDQMQLILAICTRLQCRNDLFSISIRQAIRDNKPTRLILDTCKDAIKDNRRAIEEIFGVLLTEKILKS